VNEAIEEGIAIGMGCKPPMRDASFRFSAHRFDDPAVEALDEAVGLRLIRLGQAVVDLALSADAVERMPAGWPILWLVLHIDREAIGELAAIVGEDGVNRMREVVEEAFEETGCCLGIALGVDLQIDVAGGSIDRHEGVAFASFEGWQVLEIDMNEADGCLFEDADRRLFRLGASIEAVADQAAVDGAARELGIDATPHHLGDVVERQLQLRPQLADQCFFESREAGRQCLRRVRAVRDGCAIAPTADRGLAHPQFGHELRNRFLAALNVSADFRCGRGVGVQVQLHDARRSLMKAMPRSTPIPSNQSPGTKHGSGDPVLHKALSSITSQFHIICACKAF
jgi:hypothetical protein